MDQFIVKPLFGDGAVGLFTVTNVTLWLFCRLAVDAADGAGHLEARACPTRSQSVAELAYGFIYKMVEDVTGKDGLKYFPYIMTLFLFIVFANFLAPDPDELSPTSHIAVTAVLGDRRCSSAVTVLGFVKNGAIPGPLLGDLRAAGLRPVIAIIEIISYFVRPVSHSIRLAGNLMAGHAVIKVFAGFAAIAAVSPFRFWAITAIYGLEVLVAFIQAYVFTILTCVYLKDALHPHH